jgi:excisionase family DNA binding protein
MSDSGKTPDEARPAPLLYSRKEAAKLLSISIRKIDYLLAEKRLIALRIDRRVLFSKKELIRFARNPGKESPL